MIPYNKNLVSSARRFRKNMTPEEKHLWYDLLKKIPYTVKRQHNIGNFIVDFYIAEKKTVIEIDGKQHRMPDHQAEDAQRDSALAVWGITVLRYSNESIRRSFSTVASDILNHLGLDIQDMKPM